MDTQPSSPNVAGPSPERAASTQPEGLSGPIAPEVQTRVESAPAAPEQTPQPGAAPAAPAPAAATPPPLTAQDVAAAVAATPGPAGPTGGTPMPATAADVDVIEPEWVDKAEEAVQAHQGDPYGEEEAVEHLQQDYLQKRYGYNVSNPNADGSKPGAS